MSDLVIGDIPVLFENMTKEIAFLKQELAAIKKAEIIEQPVDIKQAAEFLHVAKQTVYQWVCKRKIPFHKQGGVLLFYKSEINKWIRQGNLNPIKQLA
jgi:excisionase family DNA binding protein